MAIMDWRETVAPPIVAGGYSTPAVARLSDVYVSPTPTRFDQAATFRVPMPGVADPRLSTVPSGYVAQQMLSEVANIIQSVRGGLVRPPPAPAPQPVRVLTQPVMASVPSGFVPRFVGDVVPYAPAASPARRAPAADSLPLPLILGGLALLVFSS